MKIKNYSLSVHALHSRLQLVRTKINAEPGMSPAELIGLNTEIFDRAAESVQSHHQIECSRFEYHGAAELFMVSFDPLEKEILKQPIWEKKKIEG